MGIAFFYHWSDFDFKFFAEIAFFLTIALVAEIGVSLREELSRRKRKPIWNFSP
jgi:hypothetical protein